MNIIEPGIRNLATAKELLLTPYGLDEAILTRVLADIFTHRVDYADLYFQTTRSEAWSLEEGIVKSGSFSIDQGVGVRAVAGDRTAFAYSDDLSAEAIHQAAAATRAIAKAGGGRQRPWTLATVDLEKDIAWQWRRGAKQTLRTEGEAGLGVGRHISC